MIVQTSRWNLSQQHGACGHGGRIVVQRKRPSRIVIHIPSDLTHTTHERLGVTSLPISDKSREKSQQTAGALDSTARTISLVSSTNSHKRHNLYWAGCRVASTNTSTINASTIRRTQYSLAQPSYSTLDAALSNCARTTVLPALGRYIYEADLEASTLRRLGMAGVVEYYDNSKHRSFCMPYRSKFIQYFTAVCA